MPSDVSDSNIKRERVFQDDPCRCRQTMSKWKAKQSNQALWGQREVVPQQGPNLLFTGCSQQRWECQWIGWWRTWLLLGVVGGEEAAIASQLHQLEAKTQGWAIKQLSSPWCAFEQRLSRSLRGVTLVSVLTTRTSQDYSLSPSPRPLRLRHGNNPFLALSWHLHENTWDLRLQEHSSYSTLKETDAQHKPRFPARPALLYISEKKGS